MAEEWPQIDVTIFNGMCHASAVLAAVFVGGFVMISSGPMESLVPALCAGGFAYLLPRQALKFLIRSRSQRLSSGLPTALDLLVLSVEAGQALDVAIFEASREIRRAYPDLADELLAMHLSLRASASREEVFREFGERSQDGELRKLGQLLIDSDRFGTSLAPTLRTHARYLRIRRRQTAQEAARKVGVKLIFPIFLFIFPSVLLVTLGPAVIQIMSTLRPMMER